MEIVVYVAVCAKAASQREADDKKHRIFGFGHSMHNGINADEKRG